MGWIILGIILVLLVTPLCIPFIFRLHWRGSGMPVWSVHYGKILLAPDGIEDARRIISLWKHRLAWIGRILRPVFVMLIWIIKSILWLIGKLIFIITLPFRKLLSILESRKRDIPPPYQSPPDEPFEEESSDIIRDEYPPPDEIDEYEDDFPDSYDEAKSESGEWDTSQTTTQAEEGHEAPGDEESFADDEHASLQDSISTEQPEPGNRLGKVIDKFTEIRDKINYIMSLIKEYGPLGKRILKITFRLMRDYWGALRWKHFRITLITGGDPAELGSAKGWYHALDGALGGRIAHYIVFDTDPDDFTFSPRGTVEMDLRVTPILFVVPTLRFVVRVPYLELWRVHQRIQKERKP